MNDRTRQRVMCHTYYVLFGMVGLGVFSPLVKFFQDSYALSHAQMGTLLGMASVIGALGSFVGGVVYDRVGARITMSLATGLLALSTGGIFSSSTVLLFAAGVLLLHFSQAAAGVINVVVARLYPAERSRGIALFHGFKGAGNLLAPLVVAGSVSLSGDWRPVLLISTAVWAVWAFVFLFGLNEDLVSNDASAAKPGGRRLGIRQLVDGKLALGLFAFLFLPGSEGTIRTWLPVFLMSEAGFSETKALLALSIIMTGYTITRLLLGLRLRGDRRRIILPAVVLMGVSFFVVVNARGLALMYAFSFLLGASFAPYWPVLVGALYDYAPEDGHGLMTGLFSVFGTAGALLFTKLVGSLADAHSLKRALLVAPACAIAYGLTYYGFSFLDAVRRRMRAWGTGRTRVGSRQD